MVGCVVRARLCIECPAHILTIMPMASDERMETKSASSLKQRYEHVLQKIAEAAARRGRKPDSIIVVAVTKHASIDQIRRLIELGHVDFGENRVQNLIQRASPSRRRPT